MGANNTSNRVNSLGDSKISRAAGLSEPVKEKENKDTKALIPVAEVSPVSGFLTVRPQMTIGMNSLEKPNTPEGEKLESVVESKPTPDTRNEPQPQGQLRLTQVRLPEPTLSSKPSCWDSYARDHQSHNLQQSITPRSSHIPREPQSHPHNSPSSARETQSQDDGFTPEYRNYGIINREFQGRAIDPATGNVFEFNTRTNKIRRL